MTTAEQGEAAPPSPLLGPVLGILPAHLFEQEVLQRLGPTDLASLAGASHGCAAAVAATALMQWAKRTRMTSPGYLGFPLPPLCLKEACSHAARGGNQEVLEWLHNSSCPWDESTAFAAAGGGHLEAVKWLHNHGCPWDGVTCAVAALYGHLEVLQWAREYHCPWNSLTPSWAAQGGHLAVLQWAREHGCPWESGICMYAARAGHLEVLQWIRENDATGKVWNDNHVRTHAAGPRQQEVLTWLDQLSAPR